MATTIASACRPAPLWSAAFWRAYLITLRPHLAFVSGAAALAGLAFLPSPQAWRTALAFVPLFLGYGFGQALTDCFQTDTDALSSPYRPLVRGIISKSHVLGVSLAGLGAGIAALAALNPAILWPGLAAVAGLLAYTPLKRTWWGGPPWNAWIVALLPVMARLADGGGLHEVASSGPAFGAAVLAVFFGYGDFVVSGYFKDLGADRASGYRTFPVAFGWSAAALYADGVALAAVACMAASLAWLGTRSPLAWAALLASAALSLQAHLSLHRLRDERAAHRPIAGVVRAFLLSCSAPVLALRPAWLPFLVLFHALFEVALWKRPEPTQI